MNKVFLVGTIGSIYDVKDVGSTKVLNFSVATNDYYKGEKKTDWHRCIAWGKTAELIKQYFDKGKQIIISDGKLTYNKYEKDGKSIEQAQVTVNAFEFSQSDNSGGYKKKSRAQEEPTSQGREQRVNEDEYIEDDIPF